MKYLLVWMLFLMPIFSYAAVDVNLEVSSLQSNGEPIPFIVSVDINGEGEAEAPVVEEGGNWTLVGPSVRQSSNFTIFNGTRKKSSSKVYSYQIIPQKEGRLKTPVVSVVVDGKKKVLKQETVLVGKIDSKKQNLHGNTFGGRFNSQGFSWPGGGSSDQKQKHTEVVVSAEPSKTEVYLGELIELPFYVYYRGANVSNFEFGKFPEFKGFLKEELNVPKHLKTERSRFNGQVMYRSEIIRYAVFPIKAGNLVIDPLKMRVEVTSTPRDLFDDFFNNSAFPSLGMRRKRLEKASGATPVIVKKLPPLGEGQSFGGGVGEFSLEWTGPKNSPQVGQPFNINVTITGKGNIKAIEEPVLNFSEDLDSFKTTNRYEFKKDATGFKTFEYLFTPKRPGELRLPGLTWTYFNPETEEYVDLKTQDIVISVEGAVKAQIIGESSDDNEVDAETFFMPVEEGFGALRNWKAPQTWSYINKTFWFVPGALSLAYLALFVRAKRKEKEQALFTQYPWIATERKIESLDSNEILKICNLMDVWVRQKLIYLLEDQSVKMHSPQGVMSAALKNQMHPEKRVLVGELDSLWSELDLLRFAGKKTQKKELETVFSQIRAKVEEFS